MVNTGKLLLIVVHDMETFHETYHWKIIRRIEKKTESSDNGLTVTRVTVTSVLSGIIPQVVIKTAIKNQELI